MAKNLANKKLVVFDLDGTLTESKAPLKADMAGALKKLLTKKKVAVIGGGGYPQFEKQFVKKLRLSGKLGENLFLFPTSSTSFYRFSKNKWHRVYAHFLSARERKKIKESFRKAFKDIKYIPPKKIYGIVIEDRGSQVTFSAAGQKAPLKTKEAWKKTNQRPKIVKALKKYLPEFEIREGGLTSIDVTRKGIDKAYGIRQIEKTLRIKKKEMLFVGDAIFPGGNDYAAVKTGVDYVKVGGPKETKKVIEKISR